MQKKKHETDILNINVLINLKKKNSINNEKKIICRLLKAKIYISLSFYFFVLTRKIKTNSIIISLIKVIKYVKYKTTRWPLS